jgi:predicted GIY-YIG superfamily endonuclease
MSTSENQPVKTTTLYFIYKISDKNNPEQFYIGSTKCFSRRKSHHKKNVTNKRGKRYWTKLYVYIRQNGGWDNFTMESIQISEYETKHDALKDEQAFINDLKPPLNINNAISTSKTI